MLTRSGSRWILVALSLLAPSGGPPPAQAGPKDGSTRGRLAHWNEAAMDTTGLDHTPVGPDEARVFGEQLGPTRASRAMAIVHVAMFDAVNAIDRRYTSYTGLPDAYGDVSMDAAIAMAAYHTLVALFPSQAPRLDAELVDDLAAIAGGRAKANGMALGRASAEGILRRRSKDGSAIPEPRVGYEFHTSKAPGK